MAACAAVLALGCGGESEVPPQNAMPVADAESEVPPQSAMPVADAYVEMNGYPVPERLIMDPGLPDSCELLTQGDPKTLITEPLAPIARLENVCVVYAVSTPTLGTAITLELRRPEQLERDKGPLPSDKATFFVAQGAGVGLAGGKEEGLQDVAGLADYSVWYPTTEGMALHAYWKGEYILFIEVRGLPVETGLAWAKAAAARAIAATEALGSAAPAPPAEPAAP